MFTTNKVISVDLAYGVEEWMNYGANFGIVSQEYAN